MLLAKLVKNGKQYQVKPKHSYEYNNYNNKNNDNDNVRTVIMFEKQVYKKKSADDKKNCDKTIENILF